MINGSKNTKNRKLIDKIYKLTTYLFSKHGIGRFYLVNIIKKTIIFFLKSDCVELDGYKLFLDPTDSLGLSIFKVYELLETELAKKEIKKGDIVIDIGAHIGYFTLLFAKLVGEKGKVFSFEPNPVNFALLKKNIALNGCKNIIPIQKAISDKTGKIKLYLNNANTRIYNQHDNLSSIEIDAITLDDYFKDYRGKINFIKIDIEGAEEKAIKGMPNLLNKHKNIKMLVEFWVRGITEAGIEPEEVLKLLIKNKFRLYQVKEQIERIKSANIGELLRIYTPEKRNYTTLFCLRKKF